MQHLVMAAAVGSGLTPECESVEQEREDSGHYPVVYVLPKVNLVFYNGTSTWIYFIKMITDTL